MPSQLYNYQLLGGHDIYNMTQMFFLYDLYSTKTIFWSPISPLPTKRWWKVIPFMRDYQLRKENDKCQGEDIQKKFNFYCHDASSVDTIAYTKIWVWLLIIYAGYELNIM